MRLGPEGNSKEGIFEFFGSIRNEMIAFFGIIKNGRDEGIYGKKAHFFY